MAIRSGWLSGAFLLGAACHGHSGDVIVDAGGDAVFVVPLEGTLRSGLDGSSIYYGQACLLSSEGSDIGCADTDTAGRWYLYATLPDGPFAMRFDGPGYLSAVALGYANYVTDGVTWWVDTPELWPSTYWSTILGSNAGLAYPDGSGGFVAIAINDQYAGANATFSPTEGAGPIYSDGSGVYMPNLTSASPWGHVMFGNVPAGQYDVTVVMPDGSCTGGGGANQTVYPDDWPPTTPGTTTRVLVVDNAITTGVTIYCNRAY